MMPSPSNTMSLLKIRSAHRALACRPIVRVILAHGLVQA